METRVKGIDSVEEYVKGIDFNTKLIEMGITDKVSCVGYVERLSKAINKFKELYPLEAATGMINIFSSPGRVELCGNHTDHQKGVVLAASIDLDMIAITSATDEGGNTIKIHSEGYSDFIVDVDDVDFLDTEKMTTKSLVKGIVSKYKAMGYKLGGFCCYITTDVLPGSGLSSSAAFEVLMGTIINTLFCGDSVGKVQIAQIGRYAENEYFGKPCGLMDQMVSSVGGLLMIDFGDSENIEIKKLECDFASFGCSLCIIDTKGNHSEMVDEYASIPREMKSVASHFGAEVLRDVKESDFLLAIPTLRKTTSHRAVLRALHYFEENKRVVECYNALEKNTESGFDRFKEVLTASGRSSFCYLQNIYTTSNPGEQSLSLGLALCDIIIGSSGGAWRVHGGGFAGTVEAIVPHSVLPSFKKQVEDVFGENSCVVMNIRKVGSVALV